MNGKTHLITGIVGTALMIYALDRLGMAGMQDWQTVGAMMGAGALGSLLPDIDHPNAMLNNRLKVTRVVTWFVPHRGITHSLLAVVAMVWAWWYLSPFAVTRVYAWYDFAFLAFLGAYVLHLIEDSLTPAGVPFFAPFSKARFGVSLFARGKSSKRERLESLFVYVCVSVLYMLLINFTMP